MYLVSLFALIAAPVLAFTSIPADAADNGFLASPKSAQEQADHPSIMTPLDIGAGWYNFTFHGCGSFANRNFIFCNKEPVVLKVTDAWKAGDTFNVFDNDVLLAETPAVPVNCSTHSPLPDVTFQSLGWSSMYAFLPPGHHNIVIQVRDSPYNCGGANIRVDNIFA